MSYSVALGAVYPIKFPSPIGTQNVNIPVEQMATDAINAAWPTLQSKLNTELPKLVAKAAPTLQNQVRGPLILAGVVVVGAIAAAAWWVKKG